MKKIILLLLTTMTFMNAYNQNIVIHEDLIQRILENTAWKQSNLSLYNTSMDSIKSYKQKMAMNWAVITAIQQKIYSNLTNIDDAVKESKQFVAITQTIPKIFSNVLQASELAAGKPYLITYWNETGQALIDKSVELQGYITQFIFSHDDNTLLINQTTRDQLLWTTFNRINILYNMSANMVSLFKQYNFQDALNHVVPVLWYKNLDESITKQIIQQAKSIP